MIPTHAEYEEKCGHPVTLAEYIQYVRLNYKEHLDEFN
jgi:hypothetical protein